MGRSYAKNLLPPPDALLFDPDKEKIPTPIDDRGLILIDSLISIVLGTVDPNYEWRGKPDIHHFYWPKSHYSVARTNNNKYSTFRSLAVHKGLVPRDFHNWLHMITIPPEVPELEYIDIRIDSFNLAKNAFKHASDCVNYMEKERQMMISEMKSSRSTQRALKSVDSIDREMMHELLDKHFESYLESIVNISELPTEDQIIPLDDSLIDKDLLPENVKQIGRFVTGEAINYLDYFRIAA